MNGDIVRGDIQAPQRLSLFGVHTIIYLSLFLVPTFVIPFLAAPFQYSKTSLVLLLIVSAIFVVLYRSFRRSEVSVLWSALLISLWSLPIAYLISAILSESPSLSFFGYQLETGTFGFILLGAVLVTCVAQSLNEERLTGALKAFGVGVLVVFIFQLIQVIFNAPLPFSIFNDPTVNLIGRWNDFGVFVGLSGVLALLAFSTFPAKFWNKIIFGAVFVTSIFFLILVNVTEVWILFGSLSGALLIILLLRFMRGAVKVDLSAVVLAGVGVVAALLFLFVGGLATGAQNVFNIQALDVRPSIQGTTDVLKHVYSTHAVVGTGPNTFDSDWLLYRPTTVLNTLFWNTSFNTGSGVIPTAFVSGGLLVLCVWVIFTLLVLYTLVRAIFTVPTSGRAYTTTVFSATAVFYLLIAHYIFAPTQTLTLLLFLFLGLFIASIKGTPLIRTYNHSLDAPRLRQAYVVVAVIIVIVSLYAVYGTARTYTSSVYHERAVQIANQGNLDEAQRLIQRTLYLRKQDRYYRTDASISLAKMNEIAQSNTEEVTDEDRTSFQDELVRAIDSTSRALEINKHSYQNWITRALVYSNVVPLGVNGAFENAQATLEEARKLNPKSPEVDFRLAQINLAVGDEDAARSFLKAATQKKPNYTDAVLLLAQLEYNAGNLDQAIESVRTLVFFEPQNSVLLYQLGILFLQDQNYTEATFALEAALNEQKDYANAAFFLAQSYAFLGRTDEAAELMSQLADRNPENELVAKYVSDLKEGTNPFEIGEIVSPEDEEVQ